MPGQYIIDCGMAWYRLLLASGRIEVNVMTATVAKKHAALFEQLPNKFGPLHKAISLV